MPEDARTVLGQAWNALRDAASTTTAEEAADEYARLFIGVGKQEVFLYGSGYLAGFLNERPLVALRDDLARYGLARHEGISETEDHVATLCEVMRFLVAGDDVAVCNPGEQQRFFARHMQPDGWSGSATRWSRTRRRSSTAVRQNCCARSPAWRRWRWRCTEAGRLCESRVKDQRKHRVYPKFEDFPIDSVVFQLASI